ncbi:MULTISPECIES: DEAD/DEAH box helicase [Enterobacter cloacae complex]|uniref:DEAD/DEAH box helicase n=1 Tax=Enterobacter cloacae complex TaxID=354276 RepID=UPI001F0BB74A|nr:ATP-binding domain-containing protein [Enterobacter asburiae]MCH4303316.1 ATP-binding domain-containing protein [Enterobacter asburiae]
METVITSKHFESVPLAKLVVGHLKSNCEALGLEKAIVYFGFPKFYGYESDVMKTSDLVILSEQHGILALRFSIFNNSTSSNKIDLEWDEFRSLIFSNLYESRLLRAKKKRTQELTIGFDAYFYAESIEDLDCDSDLFITSITELTDTLNIMKEDLSEPLSQDKFNECRAILEGTKALSSDNQRNVDEDGKSTKAFTLMKLEEEIKTFDIRQRNSAVTIIDGPQRIRGLAGSGKTVVLAMKAAHIHMEYPEKKILFTFFTKSLYVHVKNLITRFYRHYKKVDPNWDNLHIKHAWGGTGVDGVYYTACNNNGIPIVGFTHAKMQSPNNPFEYVCADAIASNKLRQEYDYVLMDEAQDMTSSFFRLVYRITKGESDTKNIIWGYDELQNIFKVKTRSPRELFGQDENGRDFIDLQRAGRNMPEYLENDIVLTKCYRNPREVLISAHALGFGLYRKDGCPVQNLEGKAHWEDVGYEVINGNFEVGSKVILERPSKNSPLSISSYEPLEELIKYRSFESLPEESDWVVKNILSLLSDGLQPEDIMIIALDDRNARTYFKYIQNKLIASGILSNNVLLNPYSSKSFIEKGHITMSTIHRAKGNEAPAVLVLGIDSLFYTEGSHYARNRIFTAFTRAKAWLRVSGIGANAELFFNELHISLNNSPRLEFIQPDPQYIETLQRDLSEKSQKLKELQRSYREQLELLGISDEEKSDFFKGI